MEILGQVTYWLIDNTERKPYSEWKEYITASRDEKADYSRNEDGRLKSRQATTGRGSSRNRPASSRSIGSGRLAISHDTSDTNTRYMQRVVTANRDETADYSVKLGDLNLGKLPWTDDPLKTFQPHHAP